MTEFPSRDRLAHVARSLARHLPEQLGDLLGAERFNDGAEALRRLSDPEALTTGVAAMEPEEAAWMAELLLERWARVASVALEPAAAIVGPDEVWVAKEAQEVTLRVATLGIDDGWTAEWMGEVEPRADGAGAVLAAHLPEGSAPVVAKATVRVIGRARGQRCVAISKHAVEIRRPQVVFEEDRRRLVLSDQTGAPGVRVGIEVDGEPYVTGRDGTLDLGKPVAADATISVAGSAVSADDSKPNLRDPTGSS